MKSLPALAALAHVLLTANLCGQEMSLFNGRDLSGWEGMKEFWSVKDGAITGRFTNDAQPPGNTYLVWKGGTVADFELTCRYRLESDNNTGKGNSGIQFRASVTDAKSHVLQGYQAELDPGTHHPPIWPDMPSVNGCLTDDPPGTLMAAVGQKVIVKASGGDRKVANFEVVGDLGTRQSSASSFKKKDWNDFRLVAVGNRIQISINGLTTVDVTDEGNRYKSGLIGLQLHKFSGPNTVQYKDIKLRALSSAPPLVAAAPLVPVSTSAAGGSGPSASLGFKTYASDFPQIKILSEQSVNITGWITSPLNEAVPEAIWENVNFLKEALKDEAAQKPVANAASYGLAVQLCLKMLEHLENRDKAVARNGGPDTQKKSNLTQYQRDHLTWPQYMLEKDEREERQALKALPAYGAVNPAEWGTRSTIMRKEIEALYSRFREALRQPATAK